MLKNQKGFHHIGLLLLLVAVFGLIGLIGYKVSQSGKHVPINDTSYTPRKDAAPPSGDKRGPNYQALKACGNKPVLTTLPVDVSKLDYIAPLGNVDPPAHTLPTDHMYMMYPYGQSEQRAITVPGDMVVTSIGYSEDIQNGVKRSADYRIDAYACRELKLMFGHVDVLPPSLAAVTGTAGNLNGGDCRSSQQGPAQIKNCSWNVDIKLAANAPLGSANGWDLWATYEGRNSPSVISAKYYHNIDAVCPLDFFADKPKAELYARVKRTTEPRCGEAYQDKANTLQGGWFAQQDPERAKTDWSSHFSLTRHSIETQYGQLADSNRLTGKDVIYRFTPRASGSINVDPSQTKTGQIYCYQHEGAQRLPNGRIAGTGKVLLKTTDKHTMQAERQDGACNSTNAFTTKAITYYR